MKKHLHVSALLVMLTTAFYSFGQQRYLDEVFTDVQVTPDVKYGANYSTLSGTPTLTDLFMDVYQPANDTVDKCRPVMILLHTGSFLPPPVNGQCTGTRKDSAVVEICTEFAKRGYVAAAVSYRQGWNAVSSDQDTRTSTLLQAVYRALIDAKTAVRYFRNDAMTMGYWNTDPDKIILGGLGAGGYVALAYGSLNKPNEIYLDKFQNATTGDPYVDTLIYGNYDGFGGTVPNNVANYPGLSSEVQLIFNMGGALGDSSWLEAGEPPIVAFHCPSDPFAPYQTGAVIVPTTGDFVVEVSGSYDALRLANAAGNNDVFVNAGFNDVYTQRANAENDGYEGLFPFVVPGQQAGPWDWWDTTCVRHANGLLTNPDMSANKGRSYIDSIMGYLSPRAYAVLNPIGNCNYTSVEETEIKDITVFPNPADATFTISGPVNNNIRQVRMFDVTGRTILAYTNLNMNKLVIDGSKYAAGVYTVNIEFETGKATTKVVIK